MRIIVAVIVVCVGVLILSRAMNRTPLYVVAVLVLLLAVLTSPPFSTWIAELLRVAGNHWRW